MDALCSSPVEPKLKPPFTGRSERGVDNPPETAEPENSLCATCH